MCIAFVAKFIRANLPFLARLLESIQASNIENESAAKQIGSDEIGIGTKEFGVEH